MTAAVLLTVAHGKNRTHIVTDLPMSNLFFSRFFHHCVWSKNLTLSQAWIKQRPPLWRKHITSQFLDNFQRAVTAKMKLFERQLGEQIWFVTMIPATYAASYWNAFQTVLRMRSVPPPRTGWRALGLALFLMNWGTWQGANISARSHCLRLGSCWNAETFWTHWQNTRRNGKWDGVSGWRRMDARLPQLQPSFM